MAISPISVPRTVAVAAGCIAAGICHNDLAKEQQLAGAASMGAAYLHRLTSLPPGFKSRSRMFRIAAYEDSPASAQAQAQLCAAGVDAEGAQDFLARKSLVARVLADDREEGLSRITRGLFNFTDREGGGRRLGERRDRCCSI